MSKVVGFHVLPTPETPLYNLIDLGLEEFLPRLEEIAAAAAKEHKLETALHKMKSDWAAMRFELLPYRDTVSPDRSYFPLLSHTQKLTELRKWEMFDIITTHLSYGLIQIILFSLQILQFQLFSNCLEGL